MLILTTGGTIDKIYFDATSKYEIGEPTIPHIFKEAGVTVPYQLVSLLQKDSLEMTDEDRALLHKHCSETAESQILITHGTDTICETAEYLQDIPHKTIVLTGALAPARFRETDAIFNIGTALGAVQSKTHGVYVAMSGHIFPAGSVRKNREAQCFEPITPLPLA
ncbi:asparaginase domain-containing protein [Rubritalea tangerina]|uniref:Asparaginase domain-containing protein n=1 Tax=Rubritalea tangerina TaxID=430798 RepID=A0ABW4Z944_9BACT